MNNFTFHISFFPPLIFQISCNAHAKFYNQKIILRNSWSQRDAILISFTQCLLIQEAYTCFCLILNYQYLNLLQVELWPPEDVKVLNQSGPFLGKCD